ncbi:hypothetical protein PAXRUDRAFT_22674 [Paxillus rubicundulus Ve08.2h10]|uniref:Uncharacterized protein n=1 Tax=Paxillus rubicundulus Ve08.2h10 TaxID=930991 RepID=A0A0D0CX51_9AGAM|nr:hypothetical protein PAXRUDRAFT_22674 [Paxillus rubicundulus Ve08.2h10]
MLRRRRKSGGTESGGTESGGTESGGTESGGTESGGTEGGETETEKRRNGEGGLGPDEVDMESEDVDME